MNSIWIDIKLLDEGVDVWRPAPALAIADGLFVVLRPPGFERLEEIWEFPPGSVVRCEYKMLVRGAEAPKKVLTAVELEPLPTVPETERR
jgi:hypothetical protein